MQKNRKRIIIWLSSFLAVIILLVSVCGIYLSDYYRADRAAISGFSYSTNVSKHNLKNGVAYIPKASDVGIIFYPGGKVEASAYEPLMMAFAEKGILSVLIEMPFNLAVFDINAADGIKEQFPEVKSWYMGGHSLGGSMAASYIEKHTKDYEGLILLAAYSTADLSKSKLNVISIYGSEDRVLNLEKYQSYKANLPKSLTEVVIDGGNHAHFGVYGLQDGDGTATISNADQISITATKVMEKLKK